MNKQPQVTERTKAVLCKAFWSLYATQTLDAISVRLITDIAGYNRGTFYLYYRDVHDMLQQIEESLLNKLDTLVASLTQHHEHYNMTAALEEVLQFMYAQRSYITVLLGTHAEQFAATRCSHALWKIISTHQLSQPSNNQTTPQEQQYMQAFVTQGLLAVIVQWLDSSDQNSTQTEPTNTLTAAQLAHMMVETLIPSRLL
ncbi:TetR family transcriptional regulator [Galliscardovia ingluviei]|uniref:TetR family transcriptional regulator n=1 Tax=Galliscardovia ingluviei TaxID=1769422 RepID=A0A8J3AG12_9BIFI|nr:TetR/AcrR family transcriptional regulator [Galliscardovia ingluviei]GGI13722.1 TetR family transcriptional regulator [Galliscardovia ingluviei]